MTGGKIAELSDWDHTGPIVADFSNIHNNWGGTAVAREQPEKMVTVAAHQEFINYYASKWKNETCFKGVLFVAEIK